MPEPIYTIHDLASETGVTTRTIREWIVYGLVQRSIPNDSPGIYYTEDHLRRVMKVRDWRDSQITLRELAERIACIGEKALVVADPYRDTAWDDDE